MNIIIVGVGYVGLVTGLCFAKLGHKVHFFDIDRDKINSLKIEVKEASGLGYWVGNLFPFLIPFFDEEKTLFNLCCILI